MTSQRAKTEGLKHGGFRKRRPFDVSYQSKPKAHSCRMRPCSIAALVAVRAAALQPVRRLQPLRAAATAEPAARKPANLRAAASSVAWAASAAYSLGTYKPEHIAHNAVGIAQALTALPSSHWRPGRPTTGASRWPGPRRARGRSRASSLRRRSRARSCGARRTRCATRQPSLRWRSGCTSLRESARRGAGVGRAARRTRR